MPSPSQFLCPRRHTQMKIRSHLFSTLANRALQDEQLQRNLKEAALRFKTARDQGFARLQDPEGLRAQGRAMKERAIAHLPQLLETLESQVQKAGGVVHWARTAQSARGIVADLARTRGVKTVVKGKSMTSEEIGLNEDLVRQGLEVWETDLGEFIIQLADEPPSHLVGPAMHKSKEQIADLFAEKLGVPRVEAPEALAAIARKTLRDKFISADMGITGANAAIAETGSMVLFENEGNVRLSTTVPRIWVCIMGIEKVIPNLEDLAVLLSLLPRSATGQLLSSYVSILTGPRRESECDGPEEFHLILLDNGRTEILADPDRRETLYCIRCGACLNVCPVYQKVGGHSYGWVYSGPIGAALTPQLVPLRLARELPFASTLCGACADVCPVKIDLPKLLLTMRERLAEDPQWDGGIPIHHKLLARFLGPVLAHPGIYRLVSSGARLLGRILCPSGRWVPLPPPLSRWGKIRRLPSFSRPFSKRWALLRREIQVAMEGR
jgi:L-lactate dehydrogenase complex protein LldF